MSKENTEEPFASAIKYNLSDNTPKVLAQGNGILAKQIEAVARENNIPVLQDFALSHQLSSIPLGEEIPEAVYFVIAKLFEYILDHEQQLNEE